MSAKHITSRVEFWIVLFGGLMLAFIAGYVNTLAIYLGAPPVTHLTGSISRLSADLGSTNLSDAEFIVTLVLAFMFGAMLAGTIIGVSTLKLGRRYGVAIMIESMMLGAAAMAFPHSIVAGALLAAAAAGLQNAMAASYRSLILRTTHLTGILTDIGFQLGRIISGRQRPSWPLLLLLSIVVAFVIGGVLGVQVGAEIGAQGLWFPAIMLAVTSTVYMLSRRFFLSQNPTQSRPSDE